MITNVEDVVDFDFDFDFDSTTAILEHCANAILTPYQRLLAAIGWKPLFVRSDENRPLRIINVVYTIFVVAFILSGYFLQCISCFRRDRAGGLTHVKKMRLFVRMVPLREDVPFDLVGLVIPSLLHLLAYSYTFYLLRIVEYEQLHTLMEKAFLQTFNLPSYSNAQSQLLRKLRIFFFGCALWLLISLIAQILQFCDDEHSFLLFKIKGRTFGNVALSTLMTLMMFWHDVIHVTILWTYGIHCDLLLSLIINLAERIRGSIIRLQEAIKEINECYKFLKYLNDEVSVSVAILMVYSGSLFISGMYTFILNETTLQKVDYSASVLYIFTWFTAFVFPFIQAARLTAACKSICRIGHHIRTRPFGYQTASQQDLDSFLLYVSTLRFQAKLFRVPVHAGFIVSVLVTCVFLVTMFFEINVFPVKS